VGGRWTAALQTELGRAVVPVAPSARGALGIDRGATNFLASSDGRRFVPPERLTQLERRAKYLQRCLSRKQRGSRNRTKAR